MTSNGQCRVLSLSDAAALLARSTSSQSTSLVPHNMQHLLTELGRRIATRTVVLCKTVASSPDVASSQTPPSSAIDHHYILTTETLGEKNPQPPPTERTSDDLTESASAGTGNTNNIGKARRRPDSMKYFRSVDDVANLPESGTVHRLRHRRHHRHRQASYRKHAGASPPNRKYDRQRSRRTLGSCGGRHVDVERVAAIMKAFYCSDDEVDRLTNQLQRSADGHVLQVTSSTRQLRCRLMRRYDDCRRNFIDRVFRTGHGLAISWKPTAWPSAGLARSPTSWTATTTPPSSTSRAVSLASFPVYGLTRDKNMYNLDSSTDGSATKGKLLFYAVVLRSANSASCYCPR